MSNVYVLMEEGWEYNDEVYFHPDSGSGTPVKVFETHEAAITECNSRNIESFRDLFINPIEKNQDIEKKILLSRLIKPFILRHGTLLCNNYA